MMLLLANAMQKYPAIFRILAYVVILFAGILFGFLRGEKSAEKDFDVYKSKIQHIADVQAVRTGEVIHQQQQQSEESTHAFNDSIQAVRDYYAQHPVPVPDSLHDGATAGRACHVLPAVRASAGVPAPGAADPVPSATGPAASGPGLSEQCAETTAQLVQAMLDIQQQRETYNAALPAGKRP